MGSLADSVFLLPEVPFRSYADYRSRTGAGAVEIARHVTPEGVLAELERAGLRGRGGAGFPTASKWRSVLRHPCPARHVVCNAAEGEPGTFKDRWLIRRNPYAVLEGMLIAAQVVGAKHLWVGIKRSFQREIERLRGAIGELRDAGMLQGLELAIVEGPEEYLFGEEKALLEVLSGNEPLPRPADQPPHEIGLFPTPGSPNPAVVNNAETFAHAPAILRWGAAAFRALGTPDTPGTVLFTVSGDVQRPGIYELPAGTPLRELFEHWAGGPLPGHAFKAALPGVSAGVLKPEQFDTPADFGSLRAAGSSLGSAGFVLFDERRSAVRIAQTISRFLHVESCNQCSACKHGLRTANQALDGLFEPGKARPWALRRAEAGLRSAPQGNRCALPVGANLAVGSLLRAFRAEFEAAGRGEQVATEPVPIYKLIDYDEVGREFRYDERQPLKQPNWTYRSGAFSPSKEDNDEHHTAQLG